MADFRDNYGFFDKALHYVAFKTSKIQLAIAASESDDHRKQLSPLTIEKPTFITALPRAGTTILLELLSQTEEFCHHTYKDMPFVFTPLIWQKFASKYGKEDALVERAHGDGIKINQQSPEAFEEMFYKAHWGYLYRGASIPVWPGDSNLKFDTFFIEHIGKLMLRDDKKRYLSKNNLNITRLSYLHRLFPDGCFIVPFREPLQHAMSLLRQHQNFTKLHGDNKFAKDYMAAIGHYDFGENLKPVNFRGWHADTHYDPMQLDFWLEYWIACYQYLIDHGPYIHFVSFESLCANPKEQLAALAQKIAIDPQKLDVYADKIKASIS